MKYDISGGCCCGRVASAVARKRKNELTRRTDRVLTVFICIFRRCRGPEIPRLLILSDKLISRLLAVPRTSNFQSLGNSSGCFRGLRAISLARVLIVVPKWQIKAEDAQQFLSRSGAHMCFSVAMVTFMTAEILSSSEKLNFVVFIH